MYWLAEADNASKYIFIDIDNTIRDILQSFTQFVNEHGDSVVSYEPLSFESGKSVEEYYYNNPQIAANSQAIKEVKYFIDKFRTDLNLIPFYLSNQVTTRLQKVTTIWLKEHNFLLLGDKVHYTMKMQNKDAYIGSLKLDYKPILIDDWDLKNIQHSEFFRININGKGVWNWNTKLYTAIKNYYESLKK